MNKTVQHFQQAASWLLVQRRFIWTALILLLALVIWRLPGLQVDNSISSWYAEGDPTLTAYEVFLRTFGNDDVIVCGIRDSLSYFDPARLVSNIELQEGLESIPGIEYVSSYLDFPFKYGTDDYQHLRGIWQTSDMLPEAAAIREWMKESPFQDRLIGQDPGFVLFYLWPDTSAMPDAGRSSILAGIDSVFEAGRLSETASLYKGGFGVVYEGINQATLSEGALFLMLSYLVLILAMLLISRSMVTTLLAVLVISFGNMALLGFMELLGKPINLVTLALPPLIMVIGVSNFVHFILHAREKAGKKATIVVLMPIIAFVAVPITFNMLTTAGGFLSLTTSSIPITRDYGLLAAVSIAFVSLFAILAAVYFHKRLLDTRLKWDPVPRLQAWSKAGDGMVRSKLSTGDPRRCDPYRAFYPWIVPDTGRYSSAQLYPEQTYRSYRIMAN